MADQADWKLQRTLIADEASIGSGTTILGGLRIGERAVVGAGSVVTRDVADDATVAGNPATSLDRSHGAPARPEYAFGRLRLRLAVELGMEVLALARPRLLLTAGSGARPHTGRAGCR